MGTRSRIGVMHGDVCTSVYCHWDGYPEHNGEILFEHYDLEKTEELVSLGNLAVLQPDIGRKHAFDKGDDWPNNWWCTFYGRDRGDTFVDSENDSTFKAFLVRVDNCFAEWYYILKDGVWYYGSTRKLSGNRYRKLVLL